MKSTKPWKKPTPEASHAPSDPDCAIVIRPNRVQVPEVRDARLRLEEARGLAAALDLRVAHAEIAPLRRLDPATYFGAGRVEGIGATISAHAAGVAIVDTALTPVQQRNLERAWNAKVVDRTGLILEIFGRRAQTREGRLQVELARLGYERSRLVRTWTHLERQRGGMGKTGGPGETQIELDRRQIADRIVKLKADLEDVRRTRSLQRRARARANMPSIVLVGYTNAGKSSLFNRLTAADVLAKDMPFATLDPTARLLKLPGGRSAILSDTVGFITDLPTELVESFRATLEAVTEAALVVHVRDIASPETEAQKADVLAVLDQLAKAEGSATLNVLEVWNKVDALAPETRDARARRASEEGAVAVSALTALGVEALLSAIEQTLFGPLRTMGFALDPADGRARARLAAAARITAEEVDDEGRLLVTIEADEATCERLAAELSAAQRH
jgi:GTP-binding protein HflX